MDEALLPPEKKSWMDVMNSLPEEKREAILKNLKSDQAAAALGDWFIHARREQIEPPGDWWFAWMIMGGRGSGKLLSVDTPLASPIGWAKMGKVQVGDQVFDERGFPCNVTYVSPAQYDKTYKLTFSDGTNIIAGASHQWVTWTQQDRELCSGYPQVELLEGWPIWRRGKAKKLGACSVGPRVRTTQEIVDSFTCDPQGNPNHSIPVCDPLWLPEVEARELRFESWYLGYHIAKGQLDWSIPRHYLRTGEAHRIALLHGLMEGAGHVDAQGRLQFSTNRLYLAHQVLELFRTLGECPTLEVEDSFDAPSYRVVCIPSWHEPFVFPQQAGEADPSKPFRHRMIVDYEQIDPVPMRCISVDSPSHLYLAGEGMIPTHNTWSGANWIIDQHMNQGARNSVVVAATANDLRNYCIEGPSGILNLAPTFFMPNYIASKNKLIWPNGTETTLISSEKPDRIRGGNFDRAWCDELSYWQRPDYVWDMLQFALRLGNKVKMVLTMTPRPLQVIRTLMEREGKDIHVTRCSTYDNQKNLSSNYIDAIIKPFEGTSLGRQELEGELLMDVENALWNHELLERCRIDEAPELDQVVVGVDPSASSHKGSARTGIVVAGTSSNKLGFVLADKSVTGSPQTWAKAVVSAYHWYSANYVVAEKNQGGDMVAEIIHSVDPLVPVRLVHASQGKHARAEPVAALYEQGKVYHVGIFAELEDEMCLMVPGELKESPDRVDALVWALTHLMVKRRRGIARAWGRRQAA